MPFLSVDLDLLGEKFCPANKEFLLRTNDGLNAFFSQLYHAPKNRKLDYFRVKTAELLILLSAIDTAVYSQHRQYFPASQTVKIKEIHSLITGRLDKTFTVGVLVNGHIKATGSGHSKQDAQVKAAQLVALIAPGGEHDDRDL